MTTETTLSAIETAVYDTLVDRDAALTVADLAGEPRCKNYSERHVGQAVDRLAQDGLLWVEGNLVGIVEE